MFALCDKEKEPCLALSVMPNGWAMISAPHRNDDGNLDDSFRLIITNGEPEMIMRDAIFKNKTIVSPRGSFLMKCDREKLKVENRDVEML